MKNKNNQPVFPFAVRPDERSINDFFEDSMNMNGRFFNELLEMKQWPGVGAQDGVLTPDPYGCEKLFVDFFVTEEMEDDFPLIARDFFIHEYTKIKEYEYTEYFDLYEGNDWPANLFNRFVMNLIVNAADGGSEYAKALLIHLYKTYYRKEYKVVKRFSEMSASEALSIAKPENGRTAYLGNLARLLFMSKMMGIRISLDCNYIYGFFNDFCDQVENAPGYSFLEGTGDVYIECRKEIEEKYDIDKLYALEKKQSKFLGNVLKRVGYSPDYVDWCDDEAGDLVNDLAGTLAILKKTFPPKEYTAVELMTYYLISHCATALTSNADWLAQNFLVLAYGEDGTDFYDHFPSMFKPEEVTVKNAPAAGVGATDSRKQEAKPKAAVNSETAEVDKELLLKEIETLRRKVHRLEADNASLHERAEEYSKLKKDCGTMRERMDAYTRELAALRSHVYRMTADEVSVPKVSYEEMKAYIASKRIVVIGGHINWIMKLQREFPDWKYVGPDAGGSTDVSIVDKADFVYFFSDTISHAKYYQFLNVLRERRIDFGYIHGVNIEKNVKNIYEDLQEAATS